MVVHPKTLGDPTLYAIDQFVLHGGHAMIFVDPLAESDRSGGNPMNPMGGGAPRNSDLPKLFEAWGLEMVPGKVLGDLAFGQESANSKASADASCGLSGLDRFSTGAF